MRGTTHPERRPRARSVASLLCLALLIAACGSSATPMPSPSPTPTPTPDPHLSDPASVADVFRALGAAGLHVTANNAVSGGPGGEPLKKVNANFDGWPLILSEFSSAAALATSSGFVPGATPTRDDAPFSIAGLNILVEYGPHAKNTNDAPADQFRKAAQRLVDVLDPLLSPLAQSSVVPLDVPGSSPSPVPSGAPASAAPSAPAPSPSS
jgi:hypothetical protein